MVIIIVIRVFSIFILPLSSDSLVYSRIKAAKTMEDKCPFNLDKFHL